MRRRRRPRRSRPRRGRSRTCPACRADAGERPATVDARLCTNASVDVRSAGVLTNVRSAEIISSSRSAVASRATIGTVGTPVNARYVAACRCASVNGPPAPNPVRSALLSTATVGRSTPIIAWSSGLSVSAITTTCRSATESSGVTVTPADASAATTVPRPTPSRPSTVTRSGEEIRLMIGVNRGLRLCSANRVSASAKMWWPSLSHRVTTRSPSKCWHLRGAGASGVLAGCGQTHGVPAEGNCWVSICPTMRVLKHR